MHVLTLKWAFECIFMLSCVALAAANSAFISLGKDLFWIHKGLIFRADGLVGQTTEHNGKGLGKHNHLFGGHYYFSCVFLIDGDDCREEMRNRWNCQNGFWKAVVYRMVTEI